MTPEVKSKCFMIMPFSNTSEQHTEEYWTQHFEDFLKPIIESTHQFIAERSSPLRGDILRTIITDLVTAPLVVADLTDANPNVYWELGVRQSFKHCTITIAEHGTKLPFDLGGKGTLFYYPGNHIKMREFEKRFHDAIDDCLRNPDLPDSHVLETIGGRGTLYQILVRDESVRRLDAIMSEISNNKSVFRDTMNTCKANIELRKEKKAVSYPTELFRTAAGGSLVVNRYIDAPNSFYELAESYIGRLNNINARLVDLPSRPSTIEHWLFLEEEPSKRFMEQLSKNIRKYKKEIEGIT